ncbi:hypothetical protein ACIRRH_39575 [Kitasatospora sp. NPDC101235]|uniref:hypothetical protein n=1 Tax=Kitasatospora sp. NPDC101235 TaxID=3364101 RepID=UPI00380722B2
MGSKRKPYWWTFGTPTTLVLYRTPERWRYAVYFTGPKGVADGALDHPAASGEPESAQAAMHRKAEELTRRELEVTWQETDQPGWWTGVVTNAGPVPAA